ncbi:MAG: hypothetical protein ACK55Z_37130, partial [bacterium]
TNSCWEASPGVRISPRRPLASPAPTLPHSSASLWVLRTRASTYALAPSLVPSRSPHLKTLTANTIHVYEAESTKRVHMSILSESETDGKRSRYRCTHVYAWE